MAAGNIIGKEFELPIFKDKPLHKIIHIPFFVRYKLDLRISPWCRIRKGHKGERKQNTECKKVRLLFFDLENNLMVLVPMKFGEVVGYDFNGYADRFSEIFVGGRVLNHELAFDFIGT